VDHCGACMTARTGSLATALPESYPESIEDIQLSNHSDQCSARRRTTVILPSLAVSFQAAQQVEGRERAWSSRFWPYAPDALTARGAIFSYARKRFEW